MPTKRRRTTSVGSDKDVAKIAKTGADKSVADREAQPSRDRAKHIQVVESTGDLFGVAAHSVLVHACNCQGTWGAGIAAAFKSRYPAAFKVYKAHCDEHRSDLLGTCLLIPPQKDSNHDQEPDAEHWIGCLFTSAGKGRQTGSKQSILDATSKSMRELFAQIQEQQSGDVPIGAVKMCKINSGLFKVPWSATKAVVEGIEISGGDVREVEVITRTGD